MHEPGDDPPLATVPDQIRLHARSVDRLTERLSETRAAANRMCFDTGSYGLINQWMPALLDDLLTRAVDCIDQTARATDSVADVLRASADGYDSADQAADSTVRKAGGPS